MHRESTARSLVAGLLILAMVGTVTGLFGATGVGVKIASPAAGSRVADVLSIAVVVSGSAKVAYVILGIDEERPFSKNAAPYTFELDTTALSDGPHKIFAEAYDSCGLIGSSKAITIYVRNSPKPVAQARKTPTTRIASKPKLSAPTSAAAKPAPAARAAAKQAISALVVAAAAEPQTPAAAAQVKPMRGPLPEPSRSPASQHISPALAATPESGSRASFAAAAAGDQPRTAGERAGLVRGHTLMLNGQPVLFSVSPFIASGRMHAGFRGLFQATGAKVTWQARTRMARSIKGANTVEVACDSSVARVNGQPVDMGARASIRESRMMIPLRFFAAVSSAALHWDSQTKVADLRIDTRTMAERPLQ